jgi:hypothetical protein
MKIFIGWDSREDIAYQVCKESLARNSSEWLDIKPIKQQEMRERGLYWREHDPLSSTEFSFTRFLVPYLAGYEGWALFMDCDFLWRGDVAGIMDYADPSVPVMVYSIGTSRKRRPRWTVRYNTNTRERIGRA